MPVVSFFLSRQFPPHYNESLTFSKNIVPTVSVYIYFLDHLKSLEQPLHDSQSTRIRIDSTQV